MAVATVGLGMMLGLVVVGAPHPLIALALCLGLLVTGLLIARIEWGLFVYVFITYSYLSTVAIDTFGIPSMAKLLALLLAIGIVSRWVIWGERPTGWGRISLLMGVYFLICAVSMSYAQDLSVVMTTLVHLVKDALTAILVVVLITRFRVLRGVTWSLLAAGILMGSVGAFQHLTGSYENTYWGLAGVVTGDIVGESSGYRIGGPIGEPNFFALILLALIPLAVDRTIHEKSFFLRSMAIWALVACVLSLLFTYSRGGFMALVGMMGAALLLQPPRLKTLAAILIIGGGLLFCVPSQYLDRMVTLSSLMPGSQQITLSDDAIQGRKSEMVVALHMFLDHPLVGVGLGNYQTHYQKYAREVYLDARLENRKAHSRYLEILAETGLVGFASFGLLLWMMFLGLWQARTVAGRYGLKTLAGNATAFGITMLGVLIASVFLHDDFSRFFWLLVGIAFAIPNVAHHEIEAVEAMVKRAPVMAK